MFSLGVESNSYLFEIRSIRFKNLWFDWFERAKNIRKIQWKLRVLLSCGLQESACGPHGLPTDSLFLTNLRTPIIFFSSCFTAAQLLLSNSWFAVAKIRVFATTYYYADPQFKISENNQIASPCILVSLCWWLHYCWN